MAWYFIVLIALAAFILGFTAALFWLRDVIRRIRKGTPDIPGVSVYTQMNPYLNPSHCERG